MLKNHWRFVSGINRIGDNLIVIAAFFLTYHFRDLFLAAANSYALPFPQEMRELGPISDYLIVLGIALPIYNAVLSIVGGYRSMRFSSVWRLLRISIVTSAVAFLAIGAGLYALKLDLSRSFVGTFTMLCAVGLLIERLAVLWLLRYFRLRGRNFRNLLIVGTGDQARKIFYEVVKQREFGVRVTGFVDLHAEPALPSAAVFTPRVNAPSREAATASGAAIDAVQEYQSKVYDLPARIVASFANFEAALKRYAVDEVVFTEVSQHFTQIDQMAQIAVEEGITVTLVADIFSLEILKSDISYFANLPLIHYQPTPSDIGPLAVKRTIDILGSAILVVVLSPLLLLTALAIKLESAGPVFFSQKRVGLNGRTFTLLKFRSMIKDAEVMLGDLQQQNEMRGPVFKIKNDPRVTRVGRFIRRYSIDELPQLFNILRGDMSLVGPRPPLPSEVSLYERKQRRRLSMRPGLTCIWQVSGRNDIPDFEEWAKLDLEYIDNWSLLQDFKLLLKTIPAVLGGSGAR